MNDKIIYLNAKEGKMAIGNGNFLAVNPVQIDSAKNNLIELRKKIPPVADEVAVSQEVTPPVTEVSPEKTEQTLDSPAPAVPEAPEFIPSAEVVSEVTTPVAEVTPENQIPVSPAPAVPEAPASIPSAEVASEVTAPVAEVTPENQIPVPSAPVVPETPASIPGAEVASEVATPAVEQPSIEESVIPMPTVNESSETPVPTPEAEVAPANPSSDPVISAPVVNEAEENVAPVMDLPTVSNDSVVEEKSEESLVNKPTGVEIVTKEEQSPFLKLKNELDEVDKEYQQKIINITEERKRRRDEIFEKYENEINITKQEIVDFQKRAQEHLANAQAAEQIAMIAQQNAETMAQQNENMNYVSEDAGRVLKQAA